MNKNIINKLSTLGIITSITALVVLSNPFSNVELDQVSASGYGSAPNKASLTLKDDCRVNWVCSKTEDKKDETKIEDNKKNNDKKDENKTETINDNRIQKVTSNGLKYSLSNKACSVSMDIANPNYTSNSASKFTDIESAKNKADIEKLAMVNSMFNEPIVHGTTPTTYEPNRSITRAEFLAIALQSHCIDVYKKAETTPFTDLTIWDWKTNVVSAALERGIIAGDTKNGVKVFRANDAITKIEALAIITSLRNLKLEETYNHSYKDSAADWQNRVLSIVEGLWIEDKSISFKPNSTVTRNDMAHYIVKTVKLY